MRFTTDKVDIGLMPTYLDIAAEVGIHGRVCELGVRNGDSLEMWQALFPRGIVVGVDDNSETVARWPDGTIEVVADQADPTLHGRLRTICDGYDLIVDDASHDGRRTRASLEALWPLVVPGGRYAIEDWTVGFPWWPNHDDSMLVLARDLVNLLDRGSDVESITYQYALIVLRKRVNE